MRIMNRVPRADWRSGLLLLAVSGWAGLAATVPRVDFSREIRPVLSDNCFACHGPDTTKVKSGLRLDQRDTSLQPARSGRPAIVPGKPESSELIARITTADPDDLMPPPESHKVLSAVQRDILRRWIAEGAEYRGHWAYTPPVKPVVPPGTNALDFLVRERLASIGLAPAPAADRRTLARRLYFDLLGLPPTPTEVTAFEQDSAPGAYERLVERLLDSPHHGERLALGWLDLVRFADTIGYHSDNPRPIWPYRDYVIRAFNENKPFDQFTREQLAGDLLPGSTLEQKVASGFNRLLLTTEEGGAQPKDYEARYLTDRVRAVGTVWLGQTLGCAACHDHKFDPITMRDFYSLGAFFADIKEPIVGSRGAGMLVPNPDQAHELDRLTASVGRLQQQFDAPHPELDDAFAAWKATQQATLVRDALWQGIAPAQAVSAGEATLKILDDRSVIASGTRPDKDTYTLRFTNAPAGIVGLRLEALPDDSLPGKGPGRADNGNFVLTELSARVEEPGSDARRLTLRAAHASIEQSSHIEANPYQLWSAASAIDQDARGEHAGWAILPQTGQAQLLEVELDEPLTLGLGEVLVVELRQQHGQGHHTLGRFRFATTPDPAALALPVRVSPPKELADLLRVAPDAQDAAHRDRLFALFKGVARELDPLRQELAQARKAQQDFEATLPRTLVTEVQDPPRTVRVLPRGNFLLETGDLVEPALPAYLARPPAIAPTGRLNRLDLANWLVARDNPLTARVVVNRLWKRFFGVGLSKVLDDFGAQGEPPRNPALLDWLACEFMDSGWDVRHLIRLMVLSETYQQSSAAPRDLLVRDPDNREFSRQGRWRIEAELVRDTALSVSGLLAPTLGGPSVRPYQPDGYWENLNFPPRTYEASQGADQYRRGLYVWWQRSFLHPSLVAFDAPSREECVAERNRSNIPQQALVLLNDPTYVEAARVFAARILGEAAGDTRGRLTWAWQQVLARRPDGPELDLLLALLEKQLQEYRADPHAAAALLKVGAAPVPGGLDPAELAAWTNVARALLNLHETITRS